MSRALSNKALAVLMLLRDEGSEMTAQVAADLLMERTPCSYCGGSGKSTEGRKCLPCYGRGQSYFGYPQAYVALKQLEKRGLVERRWMRDEWGDETRKQVWKAADHGSPDDPLEAQFRAPAAERG